MQSVFTAKNPHVDDQSKVGHTESKAQLEISFTGLLMNSVSHTCMLLMNSVSHTCMLLMASCSCSSWWAELSASKRMSVSLRSFSHSSERNSDTSFSSCSVSSRPSHDLPAIPTSSCERYIQIILWRKSTIACPTPMLKSRPFRRRYPHYVGFWEKMGRMWPVLRSPLYLRTALWVPFYWRPCWRSSSAKVEQKWGSTLH